MDIDQLPDLTESERALLLIPASYVANPRPFTPDDIGRMEGLRHAAHRSQMATQATHSASPLMLTVHRALNGDDR